MYRLFLTSIALFSCFQLLVGQELKFQVKVVAPVNLKADPAVYRQLEVDVQDFFNKTKWTDHEYTEVEKIEGNVQITVTEELSSSSFLADLS